MDAKLKSKWLRALRSGKYRQTKEKLKRGNSFCCLGVLCDIQKAEWETDETGYSNVGFIGGKQANATTQSGLIDELLRPKFAGGLRISQQQKLAEMNDAGKKFKQIAEYIEENY